MAEAQEIYGQFQCTHFQDQEYLVGKGNGDRAEFMNRDILKNIANTAIKDAIAANKKSKCSKKIDVTVSNKGAFLAKESDQTMLHHIPGIQFHCLVMGKNSAWSKKQMAVLMSRLPAKTEGAPPTDLLVHTIEFPKKKQAADMFQSFVKLMTYLRTKQEGRQFNEKEAGENEHDKEGAGEDDEYLSIMTSGPL